MATETSSWPPILSAVEAIGPAMGPPLPEIHNRHEHSTNITFRSVPADDLLLGFVAVAGVAEFCSRQGGGAGKFDLGELVDRDHIAAVAEAAARSVQSPPESFGRMHGGRT